MFTTKGVVTYPLFATGVCGEVIDRHFDAFALLQFPQDCYKQLKVKSIWMIKVVLVPGCKLLFLFAQHLKKVRPTYETR